MLHAGKIDLTLSDIFQVKFFSGVDLSETKSLTLSDTVLDISMYGNSHMVLGSTSIQLVNVESPEKRRTVADNLQDDENLLDPPLHLTQFGPKGQMATASVENCTVKLWPQVPHASSHITHPEGRIHVGGGGTPGSIYRYSGSVVCNCAMYGGFLYRACVVADPGHACSLFVSNSTATYSHNIC